MTSVSSQTFSLSSLTDFFFKANNRKEKVYQKHPIIIIVIMSTWRKVETSGYKSMSKFFPCKGEEIIKIRNKNKTGEKKKKQKQFLNKN